MVSAVDGNIRIWKDFTIKGKQKLITAFSSIQSHGPGVHNANVVVDWQQQSGYLVTGFYFSLFIIIPSFYC